MAFLAIDAHMFAQEREPYLTVIKPGLGPAPFIVTLQAFFTFLPLMDIVVTMAGVTFRFQFFLEQVPFMTTNATYFPMPATQPIFRCLAVVEDAQRPAFWCMATFTLGAEFAAVLIVFFVTGATGFGCIFMVLCFMARLASNVPVFTDQRVVRLAVIKSNLSPAQRAMTVCTFFS
jgi:hypothetical protein